LKTHLNLHVADLKGSVAFYQTLLQLEPSKNFDDYALFLSDAPPLELALDRAGSVIVGDTEHFGIVVDSVDDVEAAIARFQSAGLPIDVEREETCCYANQTKVWVADPDGRRWEVYTVLEDTEQRDEDACCSTEAKAEECCAV
jgi:catechol 2,3-dioxygenase-like lactoylglutathione lyase family enzyme